MKFMETNQIISFVLAILVGITLGLIGSGGSILTVPIMVYVVGINPVLATAYSLFVVGSSAFVGGIKKVKQQLVDFKMVLIFGTPAISAVFATRKFIVPSVPKEIFAIYNFSITKELFLMVLFAIVMIFASFTMIKPRKETLNTEENQVKINYFLILFLGATIGFIAGLVGAGGGFLIIPALVILAKTPMKTAIGTSLFIIALQSLIGFSGDATIQNNIDWEFLLTFTFFAIIGIFIGDYLSKKIDGNKLKTGFGWFVLAMGIYIIIKELVFLNPR
jgi:uncharacterized protein